MHSNVTSIGCTWRTCQTAEAEAKSEEWSTLIISLAAANDIGIVRWKAVGAGPTYEMEIHSSDDSAWSVETGRFAIQQATKHIVRAADVARISFLFPIYALPFTEYALGDDLVIEGLLPKRYYLEGKYWNGVQTRTSQILMDRLKQGPSISRHDLMPQVIESWARHHATLTQKGETEATSTERGG